MIKSYYSSNSGDFKLYLGDCSEILDKLDCKINLIFADPLTSFHPVEIQFKVVE